MTGVQTCALPIYEDKKRRALIEDRNKLDTLIYSTDKSLAEHGSKLQPAERAQLEEAIAAAKKAVEGEDHAAVQSALEALTKASHKLAETVYQQASAAGSTAQPQDGARQERPADDGVIDAEYVDVDKKD